MESLTGTIAFERFPVNFKYGVSIKITRSYVNPILLTLTESLSISPFNNFILRDRKAILKTIDNIVSEINIILGS